LGIRKTFLSLAALLLQESLDQNTYSNTSDTAH